MTEASEQASSESDARVLLPDAVPVPSHASQWCEDLVARVEPGGIRPQGPDDAKLPSASVPDIGAKYELVRRIGSGGVGEVWQARNVGVGRDVAVKLLRRSVSENEHVRERFLREARLASAARHPGIVDVLDFGVSEQDGRPYIVMEFLEGVSLADDLREHGPYAWEKVQRIVGELVDALAHAHARKIVHRDLKPTNVMLVRRAGAREARCVVIDFGMAKGRRIEGADATLTATGEVFGSPAYMSPEQFRGQGADARSDVYALGCMVYEMLVGERPYAGANAAELMYQHLLAPFPKLPDVTGLAGLDWHLRRLLARACHKAPNRRFQTMVAFGEAVETLDPSRGRARWGLAAGLVAVSAVGYLGYGASTPDVAVLQAAVAGPAVVARDGPAVAEAIATTRTVKSLHGSVNFTCALSEDGAVQCWGKTGSHFGRPDWPGHVGDDERPSDVPHLDFGGHAVMSLAVSYWSTHLCALLDDGSARCWGDNGRGQLGLGEGFGDVGDAPGETPGATPAVPLEGIRKLYTQAGWTCALSGPVSRSEARCWGQNQFGQLGQGHARDLHRPPAEPIDFGGAIPQELSIGLHHACAQLDDGTVRCWGSNNKLQLGNELPHTELMGDGIDDVAERRTAVPNTPAFGIRNIDDVRIAQVRANGGWACVLTEGGAVRCWGGNKRGTLGYRYDQIEGCKPKGLGDKCPIGSPVGDVRFGDLGGARLVDLRQGRQRSCALDDRGAVRCWGHSAHGALGYGTALDTAAPGGFIGHLNSPSEVYARLGTDGVVDIGDFDRDGAIDRVRQLAVGYNHVCVLVEDGSVRCWGGNGYGQLGYGTLDTIGDDETPAEYYASHGVGAVSIWHD